MLLKLDTLIGVKVKASQDIVCVNCAALTDTDGVTYLSDSARFLVDKLYGREVMENGMSIATTCTECNRHILREALDF